MPLSWQPERNETPFGTGTLNAPITNRIQVPAGQLCLSRWSLTWSWQTDFGIAHSQFAVDLATDLGGRSDDTMW